MNSSAETFEATKMHSQPTALPQLRSTHSESRKHVWMEVDTRPSLARTQVIATVDDTNSVTVKSDLRPSSRAIAGWH